MFNMRNNGPFGSRNAYQYQTLPYGYEGGIQASGLISKVMGLLALCFVVAAIGAFVGAAVLTPTSYIVVVILGFVVLLALRFLIQKQGLNLFLLYLFAFIEGMGLGPTIGSFLQNAPNILGEAFILTALTAFGLAIYSWTTKRDFTRIGDYLLGGLILLLVASIVGLFFFHSTLFQLVISVVGVAVFSGFVLYYVQRARYMADTMPNAIGLTVSLFITLINLFLYILEILSIVQGGGGRRR
jgi:modulator of FtsH protease